MSSDEFIELAEIKMKMTDPEVIKANINNEVTTPAKFIDNPGLKEEYILQYQEYRRIMENVIKDNPNLKTDSPEFKEIEKQKKNEIFHQDVLESVEYLKSKYSTLYAWNKSYSEKFKAFKRNNPGLNYEDFKSWMDEYITQNQGKK